jgi:hypothetical protein
MEAPERPRQWVWQDEDASEPVRDQSEAGCEMEDAGLWAGGLDGAESTAEVEGREPARTKFKK